MRRDANQKSNSELISALRSNFQLYSGAEKEQSNGNGSNTRFPPWTHLEDDGRHELEIPRLDFEHSGLQEEREQYDITAKLFFLPGADHTRRDLQIREALNLVFKELHVGDIDLLIVSFPGIYFDEEEDCPNKLSTRGPVEAEPEAAESYIATWKSLEKLHDEGKVSGLGIAEFGRDRLSGLLDASRVKPVVDQINLRDCCSVPKDLLTLAKSKGVELLVHNDSSNILPRGTTRELLGPEPQGAGVLADSPSAGEKRKREADGAQKPSNGHVDVLTGDVQPQWVIKYTAVVKNRGVVENKGYFAVAELAD